MNGRAPIDDCCTGGGSLPGESEGEGGAGLYGGGEPNASTGVLKYVRVEFGGRKITDENELNGIYGLSRMTVRGVLNKLASDGLLFRVQGKGTYVAPGKISAVSPSYRGVLEQLESMGYDITTRLISNERVTPPHQVRDRLRLGSEEVFAIVRLRSVDAKAISLHRSFVPAHLAPDLDRHDLVNDQLCVVLEKYYGLPMKSVAEDLEAVAVEPTEAGLLGLRVGDPALLLTDVISDPSGKAFEFSKIVFRGDTMRLRFDYAL